MLENGSKIKHVRSDNFIAEMVDSFNISAIQTAAGSKISLIVGRDMLSVNQETLEAREGGFGTVVLPDDMILTRHVVANLSMPLDSAKQLLIALQTGIAQLESQATPGTHS